MTVQTKNHTDLYRLYQFYQESGDSRRAGQLKSFIQKQQDDRFVICFSGHFSAGKSSLINELMSDNFLPTSPVPTSANVVRLSYGTPQIDIYYHDGRRFVFSPPFNEEAIWNCCKNGEDVREVHIQTNQGIESHLEWMDTPGIDSTDPLHMANTEDAVIVADHIFYVVDYNHVQASENYRFLNDLQEMGKPFHLVVSQVDKHRESEIPFESYKQSIVDSLSTWDLTPESIHFISIKDKSVSINDWEVFVHYLKDLSASRGSVESEDMPVIKKLAQDHKVWWKNQHQNEEDELKDQLPADCTKEDLVSHLAELEKNIETLESKQKNWADNVRGTVEKTVQSAILMPFDTRELARQYIESCHHNFKVGFFSSKNKVEQERKSRLAALCESLNQLILTMKRQVADSLVSSLGEYINLSDDMKQRVFSINILATEEQIEGHVEKGAMATGQYILNFTAAVESTLKKQMTMQVRDLVDELGVFINKPIEENIQQLKEEIHNDQENLSFFDAYSNFKHEQTDHADTLDQILNGDIILNEVEQKHILEELKQETPAIDGESLLSEIAQSNGNTEQAAAIQNAVEPAEAGSETDEKVDWIELFQSAAKTLKPIEGFQHLTGRLLKRADRLKNKRYTIALFGAFSAGKSSFANALMGNAVLPVSPHPTTATINRIFPVDDEHAHETVVITLKNEQAILKEINQALEPFHIQIDRIDALEKALATSISSDSHHTVFLKAVVKGYSFIKDNLGKAISIPLKDALAYISEEQKACFVDTADIYYDCELTRQGIVLVDTPGADSINARHTDTAFRFIRNADALVYVTYYNHAFSRADQEFLIQLGRVKDTFELDKMFFVINAIDLANSSAEVDDVKNYVRSRLLTFGIRDARLYGVSSLKELSNRHSEPTETGFTTFYKDWKDFVQFGLQKQSIDQGLRDVEHAGRLLDDLLAKTSLSEQDKETARKELTLDYSHAKEILDQSHASTYQSRIQSEINELFYYVKKRVIQRYIDEFSMFFNPAVLTSEATEGKKTLLRQCLDECIQFLSFDIDQEIRATYLRTESMLRKLIREYRTMRQHELGSDWSVELPDELDLLSPEIGASLKNLERSPFEASFKHYKNPKQFFEGGGKKVLRDALQEMLSEAIDSVLKPNADITQEHYLAAFDNILDADKNATLAEIATVYKQRMNALSENDDLSNQLKEAKSTLKQLYSN